MHFIFRNFKMNIGQSGDEEDEVMLHEIIDNGIKTEIVKEEPEEVDIPIKCEICSKNSDTERYCVHYKSDRLGNEEDDKLQESRLFSANKLQKNSDVITKIDSTDCSTSQEHEDSIIKLIDADITIKEEYDLDNPEIFSLNIDLVESQTEHVKTEDDDDDIFHENGKIAMFKEEPTDNEATFRSNILVKDEISIEDVKSEFSEESQEGFKRRIQTDCNNFTTDVMREEPTHQRTRNIDTVEKPFQCQHCSKPFPCFSDLVTHERIHSDKKRHKCGVCSKYFRRRCDLNRHEKIHNGERPYECEVCSKSFIRRGCLIMHNLTHNEEKPYKCEVCSKSFIRRDQLSSHKKVHNGKKPFECKACPKSFTRRSGLITHEKIHIGERPHECKVCSKSFVRRSDMIVHEKIHKGERPFKCQVCSKCFIRRNHLNMHEKLHNGERPFQCDVCSKSFICRSDLNKHKKRHSAKKPYECEVRSKSFSYFSSLLAQKIHDRPVECNLSPKD